MILSIKVARIVKVKRIKTPVNCGKPVENIAGIHRFSALKYAKYLIVNKMKKDVACWMPGGLYLIIVWATGIDKTPRPSALFLQDGRIGISCKVGLFKQKPGTFKAPDTPDTKESEFFTGLHGHGYIQG